MPVIFDMDGVLVDSEIHWKKVESNFLSSLIPRWGESDQHRILGMSLNDVYRLLVDEYDLKMPRGDFVNFYDGLATELYGRHTSLIPGGDILLAKLCAHGVPCGLASSSPKNWITIVVERFKLRDKLSVIVSADDVMGKGKPAPDIYRRCTELLCADPKHCIAIEDTDKGILSAKSAGLICVGIRNGFNDHQSFEHSDAQFPGFNQDLERFILDKALKVVD